MSDNEQDLNAQQQNLITNIDPMQLILTMQQQQIAMQEQMANLMSQLLPTSTRPSVSLDSPIRPVITADCTDNQWIIFLDAWKRYKQMSKLSDPVEIKNELRSACDATVNEMLFNFVGHDTLITANEDQLHKVRCC